MLVHESCDGSTVVTAAAAHFSTVRVQGSRLPEHHDVKRTSIDFRTFAGFHYTALEMPWKKDKVQKGGLFVGKKVVKSAVMTTIGLPALPLNVTAAIGRSNRPCMAKSTRKRSTNRTGSCT